ncbi:MAG: prepilin peptidase [Planctomycetaceae bacterium]
MSPLSLLPGLIVVLGAVAGAVADRRGFRLPNKLTLGLLAAGCLWNTCQHHWQGLGHSLAGTLVGGALLLPVYIRGGMGAGDVKMLAAVGAWLGALPVLGVFLVAGLAAGAWSVVILRSRSQLTHLANPRHIRPAAAGDFPDELARRVASPNARQELIPFGILIALGVITQFTLPLVHHFLFAL